MSKIKTKIITKDSTPHSSKLPITRILILGAGYCGLQVALKLASKVKRYNLQITVIDRQSSHVYLSELYELAAAFPKKNDPNFSETLRQTLSFDLANIFKNKQINLIVQEITHIDPDKQLVTLSDKTSVEYDYLVTTLGSENNFYGNQAIAQNAYTLKTIDSALKINFDLLQFFAQNHSQIGQKLKPRIAVIGGGFTGIELLSEFTGLIKRMAKLYSFPAEAIELIVIEPKDQLIGLGQAVSDLTIKRLQKLGVNIKLNCTVKSFDGKQMIIEDHSNGPDKLISQSLPVDFLIWTAGIQAPVLLKKSFTNLSAKFELEVKPTLEALYYKNIFVGGDNSACIDQKTKKYLPKLGQLAVQQAPVIAHNIIASILQRPLKKFKPFFKGFIVALGGKYAVYNKGKVTFGGVIPWGLKLLVDLRYFLSILPVSQALKKWYDKEEIFTQND